MDKKAPTSAALAKQVAERQEFIEKTIHFVNSVVAELGTVLYRKVYGWHTETKIELRGLAGFSFYTEGVYSLFGGQMTKVWYHHGSEHTTSGPVLEVEWWNITRCEVKRFDPSVQWQRVMQQLIEDKNGIVARFKMKQLNLKKDEAADAEREKKARKTERRLYEDAKRLKLIP